MSGVEEAKKKQQNKVERKQNFFLKFSKLLEGMQNKKTKKKKNELSQFYLLKLITNSHHSI